MPFFMLTHPWRQDGPQCLPRAIWNSEFFTIGNSCKCFADPYLPSLTAKCQSKTETSHAGPNEGTWSCSIMIIIILQIRLCTLQFCSLLCLSVGWVPEITKPEIVCKAVLHLILITITHHLTFFFFSQKTSEEPLALTVFYRSIGLQKGK